MFFFNDTATTEIYTLPLHDALPICVVELRRRAAGVALDEADQRGLEPGRGRRVARRVPATDLEPQRAGRGVRSEEHTSELQSRHYLVCRLLLDKKTYKLTLSRSFAV